MASEENLKTKVYIICPSCHKKGYIQVEKNRIIQSDRGITAVNVIEDLICSHSMIVYLDNNLTIRDSFTCDFKVQLPDLKIESRKSKKALDFDVEIIKYNLIPTLFSNVLTGVLFRKHVIIINESEFMNNHFRKFFSYLLDEIFEFTLDFIPKKEYKNMKSKDSLVLSNANIIRDKHKIIDSKKNKIQHTITQKFYSDLDPITALIILKDNIFKLFKLSEDLITFSNTFKEKEIFTYKQAIDYLNQRYYTKILFNYLILLMDIVKYYFKVDLKTSSETDNFLGFM